MERVAQYFFAKIINWFKEKNDNILKNNSKWNIKPSWQLTVFLVNITYPRYRQQKLIKICLKFQKNSLNTENFDS